MGNTSCQRLSCPATSAPLHTCAGAPSVKRRSCFGSPFVFQPHDKPGSLPQRSHQVMTIFLPLTNGQPPPSLPSFLVHTDHCLAHLRKVIGTILKAKRLVVVCGACTYHHYCAKHLIMQADSGLRCWNICASWNP